MVEQTSQHWHCPIQGAEPITPWIARPDLLDDFLRSLQLCRWPTRMPAFPDALIHRKRRALAVPSDPAPNRSAIGYAHLALTPNRWATVLTRLPLCTHSKAWARLTSRAFGLLRAISPRYALARDDNLKCAMSPVLLAHQGYIRLNLG
jgi:hypothetical protein